MTTQLRRRAHHPSRPPYFRPDHDMMEHLLSKGRTEVNKLTQAVNKNGPPKLGMPLQELQESLCATRYQSDGIGPVRCIYYRELEERFFNVLFERATSRPNISYFISRRSRRDADDWLCYDRYLSEILESLGTSWEKIEQAMLVGFVASLPTQFKIQYADPLTAKTITDWEYSWQEWHWLNDTPKGTAIARAASRLYDLTKDLYKPSDFDIPVVAMGENLSVLELVMLDAKSYRRPERMITPTTIAELYKIHVRLEELEWTQAVKIKNFSTRETSPICSSVITATANALWESVDPDAEPIDQRLRRIINASNGGDGHLRATMEMAGVAIPREFWLLVADILYHCPIIFGVPEDRNTVGTADPPYDLDAPPQWIGLKADAIRKRYDRHKRI